MEFKDVFSPYKMTANYDEKKIVIEYSKDFLRHDGQRYINQGNYPFKVGR